MHVCKHLDTASPAVTWPHCHSSAHRQAASATAGESGAAKSSEKVSIPPSDSMRPCTSANPRPSLSARSNWKFWWEASRALPFGKSRVSRSRSASQVGQRDRRSSMQEGAGAAARGSTDPSGCQTSYSAVSISIICTSDMHKMDASGALGASGDQLPSGSPDPSSIVLIVGLPVTSSSASPRRKPAMQGERPAIPMEDDDPCSR
mmetsp:Transcript_22159/g.71607  ORF Transcript_22159/g.71607 Transcript_22159/m.71607 type:complete len:204 (-) Transcript_22159:521-1132(-)